MHILPFKLGARAFRRLVASASNFAESRGARLDIPEGKDNAEVLAALFDQMNNLLKDKESIELYYDDEMEEYQFVLKDWPMYYEMVYFVPFAWTFKVKDKKFGALARRFLRTFAKKGGWCSVYDGYYFEALLENVMYEQDSLDDDDLEMYQSYATGGKTRKLIDEFYEAPLLTAEEFLAFKPKKADKAVYDLLASGIDFIADDYPSYLENFAWSVSRYRAFDENDYDGGEPIVNPIEELFSIVYENDDVIDTIVQDISSYYQSGDTEQDIPVDEVVLTPKGEPRLHPELGRYMRFVEALAKLPEVIKS